MTRIKNQRRRWGLKHWRTKASIDGAYKWMGTELFRTKREAQSHVRHNYYYLKGRKDLRGPPHGWRAPMVVRVTVTIAEDI